MWWTIYLWKCKESIQFYLYCFSSHINCGWSLLWTNFTKIWLFSHKEKIQILWKLKDLGQRSRKDVLIWRSSMFWIFGRLIMCTLTTVGATLLVFYQSNADLVTYGWIILGLPKFGYFVTNVNEDRFQNNKRICRRTLPASKKFLRTVKANE